MTEDPAMLGDLIPHPRDIDLTAEALRRGHWPKVVLIGSLGKAYPEMVRLYRLLGESGVDAFVPWRFLESPDELRENDPSWTEINDKFNAEAHLLRIRASDIAYIVNPNGYVGPNSIIDIGAALAAGKPVYSMERILDNGIAALVDGIKTPGELIPMIKTAQQPVEPENLP